MKRYIFILTLILLNMASQAQESPSKSYVIGFYNVENLFDIYDDKAKNDEEFLPEGKNRWTQAKYETKLRNIAKVLKAMKDDNGCYHTILGLSEIENRMVIEDLLAQDVIADNKWQIVHYDGPDRRGVDVALLYDESKFKFIESESIPYTFEGSKVDITLDAEEQEYFRTRDILMVHGTIEGEHFAFYVAHLPSRIGGKGSDLRSRGAEIIYNHAAQMETRYPGIKVVAMGDMNDDPFDESMASWLHGKRDIEDVKPGDFFNPYYEMLENGYGSLCYQGVWSIYDQEIVNYNLAAAPNGGLKIRKVVKDRYYGRIFNKPFMTSQKGQYKGYPYRTFSGGAFIGGYSDHYPTYIIIGK